MFVLRRVLLPTLRLCPFVGHFAATGLGLGAVMWVVDPLGGAQRRVLAPFLYLLFRIFVLVHSVHPEGATNQEPQTLKRLAQHHQRSHYGA